MSKTKEPEVHPLAAQLMSLDEQLQAEGHSLADLLILQAKHAYGISLTRPEPDGDDGEAGEVQADN